jgi:hypothetical protein
LGIGTTDPQSQLDIWNASAGSYPLTIRGDIDRDGGYTGIRFGYDSTGVNAALYQKAAIQVRGTTGNVLPDMHFMLNSGANSTSVVDSDADRVFTLRNAGTQDHWGNRIVNSQTVNDLNGTAEPSLRFDGANDTVDLGPSNALVTGTNVTVAAWVKVEGTTEGRVFQAQMATGSTAYSLVVNCNGGTNAAGYVEMMAYNGSSRPRVTYDAGINDGKWHHLAFTTTAAAQKLYVDGVNVGSGTNTFVNSSSADEAYIGSSDNSSRFLKGEIKDVRIHNRALEDTEVAAAYNGESTPWKYDSSSTYAAGYDLLTYPSTDITGTFENDDPDDAGWIDTGSSTISRVTTTQVSGSYSMFCVSCVGAAHAAVFDLYNSSNKVFKGRAFRLSFWARTSTGTNTLNTEVYGQGATRASHSITATWAKFTYEDTFYYDHALVRFYFYTDSASSNFYIDDVELVLTGEVAAYTPQSIGVRQWADTTSNKNTGQITGATRVNQPVHGGLVLGNSDGILSTSKHSYIRRDTADGADDGVLAICGGGNRGTRGGYINLYGANHTSASAIQLFGTTHTHYVGSDDKLEITAGAVKAAAGATTNLKQVARMHSKTVVVNTGTALAYTVTHNLGTRGIITSAQDANNEFVDVHVDAATDDTAVFTFASASAVAGDEDFIFTIMGGGAPEAA